MLTLEAASYPTFTKNWQGKLLLEQMNRSPSLGNSYIESKIFEKTSILHACHSP
jgi:hypothetical protein